MYMFNLPHILIKSTSIALMSVVLLITGCSLIWQEDKDNIGNRSVSKNAKMIKLPDELSASIYQILNRETPDSAYAKQPHTMGDVISGKIICDNEFIDGAANATEQKCRIVIDTTDRGVGG